MIALEPRKIKRKEIISPPLLSAIQAPPVNLETTTGGCNSLYGVSRFPSISLSTPVCYTRLGNLHDEAHKVCSLSPISSLSRLLVLFLPLQRQTHCAGTLRPRSLEPSARRIFRLSRFDCQRAVCGKEIVQPTLFQSLVKRRFYTIVHPISYILYNMYTMYNTP